MIKMRRTANLNKIYVRQYQKSNEKQSKFLKVISSKSEFLNKSL